MREERMTQRPTTPQTGRRSFLQAGFLALGGLSLGDLFRLRAAAAAAGPSGTSGASTAPPDTSVILIWLQGGPSHMETYDLKPQAPREYRGELNPISTNVPGMEICELLPQHARVADKFTLIRSITHSFANHAGGAGRFLSGRNPRRVLDPTSQYPTIGTIAARVRERHRAPVPNYIADSQRVYGGGSAYLGQTALPFVVGGDPNAKDFNVPNVALDAGLRNRLNDRLTLLKSFDRLRRNVDDAMSSMRALDKYNELAIHLLTSDRARQAFDLSTESPQIRERYGRHKWGQRALLARRLVEAGCTFVTMQMQNPEVRGAAGNWDIHAVNGHLFDDARGRLPPFDTAISALIEDIYQRGLDQKVLLIVAGEFGRTPRINPVKGTASKVLQPGRDHWPGSMSVLVSGGGMRMGQVIGSTMAKGEYPKDRKLDPNDLLATVYRFLGIDYHAEFPDHTGRPMPILPHGEPIAELL